MPEVKIAIFHSQAKKKKSCEQRDFEVEKEKDNFDWEVNVLFQELMINNSESATPY